MPCSDCDEPRSRGISGSRREGRRPKGIALPWQVWERLDGSLSVPIDATREDLCRLADKLLSYAATAPMRPGRKRGVVTK